MFMMYGIFDKQFSDEDPWEQFWPHRLHDLLEGTPQSSHVHRHKAATLDSGTKERHIVLSKL